MKTANVLFRLGALSALLTVVSALIDILTSFTAKGADSPPGSMNAREWFDLMNRRPLLGLRNLGILNVVNTVLAVPLFVAFLAAHRRSNRRAVLCITGIQLVGTSMYIANNQALRMLDLSRRYARAGSESERAELVEAGETALARGEDFTPTTYPALLLTSAAPLGMGFVMLREPIFGRAVGWLGIVGPSSILLYTTWTTFVRRAFQPSLAVAAIGGLATIVWYVLTAQALFRHSA